MTATPSGLRVLVGIANHGTKNRAYLEQLLAAYRAMRFQVDIVVLSDAPKDLGQDVEVRVGAPTDDPRSLPFAHRRLFAERADDYDLFVYSEDDTLLTQQHVEAFLEVDALLPADHVPGFLRYEVPPGRDPMRPSRRPDRWFPDIHGAYRWVPETVTRRHGEVFAAFSNEHSACYVLTRAQLRTAIDSGRFLVAPHAGRYDMLESAATDPFTQCGLSRRICVSRMDAFLLAHLPNAYVGRLGVAEDELAAQTRVMGDIADGRVTHESLLDPASRLATTAWDVPTHPVRDRAPVDVGAPTRALSVGATSGAAERAMLGADCAVTAVPLDAVLAAVARTRGLTTTPPNLDAALEMLRGETFPVVLLHHCLQHVADPVRLLGALAPLVAAGGQLVVTVPNTSFHRLKRRLGRWTPPLPDADFRHDGVHATDRRVVRRWLVEAGYAGVAVSGDPFGHRPVAEQLTGSWLSRSLVATGQPAPRGAAAAVGSSDGHAP